MIIKLQDFTPYQNSIIWKINSFYFKNKGLNAWLLNEVPYQVSSNSRFAYQKAKIFFELVDKKFSDNKEFRILEIGSGLGLFSLNFIKQFEKICLDNQKDYFQRFKYYITDISEKNLKDLKVIPEFKKLFLNGNICFCIYDLKDPEKIIDISKNNEVNIKKEFFHGIIANYIFCVLPISIILKNNNVFLEKYVETLYNIKNINSDLKGNELLEYLFKTNTFNHKLVKENYIYKEKKLEECINDKLERNSLFKIIKTFDKATFSYPGQSIIVLNQLLQIIKNNGLLLISDNALTDINKINGEKNISYGIFGDSLAYKINFPIIESYLSNFDLTIEYTKSSENILHTMMIYKSKKKDTITNIFEEMFIESNKNESFFSLVNTAKLMEKNNKYSEAINYYQKSLQIRNEDVKTIYYALARCFFDLGNYDKAIEYYSKNSQDIYNIYDFNFEKGLIFFKLGNYEKSIDLFLKTNLLIHTKFEKYYFLGKSYYNIRDYSNSLFYFEKAVVEKIQFQDVFYFLISLYETLSLIEKLEKLSIKILFVNDFDKEKQIKSKIYYSLGNYYFNKKVYEKSYYYYNKVILLYPDSLEIKEKIEEVIKYL